MNVDFSIEELRAEEVWYDASSGKLFIRAGDFVNGIDFSKIPDCDFESTASVVSFSVGIEGSMVICHHKDGAETWLPADMWEPGGFTPSTGPKVVARPRTKTR